MIEQLLTFLVHAVVSQEKELNVVRINRDNLLNQNQELRDKILELNKELRQLKIDMKHTEDDESISS